MPSILTTTSTTSIIAFLLLLLTTLTLVSGQLEVRSKCNTTRNKEADVCMQRMFMIGDRNQSFRETLPTMRAYCRQVIVLQNCVKRFGRECLPELGRQVVSLLIYGVRKGNRPYCSNEKGMVRFNEIARCGNHEMGAKHGCMADFLDKLDRVSRTKRTVENRINFVCCYFSRFKECISATFNIGDSSDRCPRPELQEKLTEMIGSYADDALELICGGVGQAESEIKCKGLIDGDAQLANISFERDGLATTTTSGDDNQMAPKSLLPYFVSLFGEV